MLQTAPKTFLDELKPYLKAQNIQPNGISLNQVEEMWFSPDECKKLLLIKVMFWLVRVAMLVDLLFGMER
jgi:type I restriction enzyme S subunit